MEERKEGRVSYSGTIYGPIISLSTVDTDTDIDTDHRHCETPSPLGYFNQLTEFSFKINPRLQ